MEQAALSLKEAPELALKTLYDRYAPLVYACARSVLAAYPREETEECVLDVFSYVYRRREEIDESRCLKAYLCRAAKSMALDRVRKLSGRRAVSIEEAAALAAPGDAESALLARETRRALIRAIHALGEPDAAIVVYRYYFSMSSKEIGKQLGMKENTVDQRLRRARLRLQRELKGAYLNDEV
ncbi:MAG: sigma-70 family RNA polymerase sigma factor [Clostridia bacterium]|nr:sigma-70 family RNA polymerase sigma factor [Clostridia bacterium]